MPLLTVETAEAAAETTTNVVDIVKNSSYDEIISYLMTNAVGVVSNIVIAAVIYIIGSWIIKRVSKITERVFEKRKVDVSLAKFIVSLISITLSALLILTAVGVMGINTSSFLAIFASAGLAIGMALSGTLQNFAGGVMILFLKPYKVGDVIEAQGYTGCVKEISLFSTLLNTPDNKMVIIPNSGLSTGSITNYSKEDTRRVDLVIGVAYSTGCKRVEGVVMELLNNNKLILQDKPKFVAVCELADSSVNFAVRAWCNSGDYWALYHNLLTDIYEKFNAEGIEFPFPQMDVTLKK